jgi:putative ABC transport system permease protein
MSFFTADYNFFDTYGVSLLAGRKFLPTDHRADFDAINVVILNLNAVQLLGIERGQDVVGKDIVLGRNGPADRVMSVIGVVGNFHQESLKKAMEPMIFVPAYSTYAPASIKIKAGDPKETIAGAETAFKKFFPGNAFEYFFLEDRYNNQYKDDNRFGNIISIFTVLAIIISCLGLIGLSSYTAVQRTKEIGIRKVLGASLVSIVTLLSVDFIRLVLLATVLSLPIAYFVMQNWLEGYAYRTTIGWMLFIVPVILILIIAALTMSFQIMKTAMTNPADTLKYE